MSSEASFFSDLEGTMREAIERAIPGAAVSVRGVGSGHFEIDVVSASFDGLTTLKRHRMVLSAIAHLMAGDSAPVHAIDRLSTQTSG